MYFPTAELPDEIVKLILDPLLKVSEDEFRFKRISAPFSRSISSSTLITISKQFLRVGTPLLYHTVVLRSAPQAQALSQALAIDKSQPGLGTYIRSLRLEGCYGAYVSRIFKSSPNIANLHLAVSIPASTSVKTLVKAFTYIRVVDLVLNEGDSTVLLNKATRELFSGLQYCLEKQLWPLESIGLPATLSRKGFIADTILEPLAACKVRRVWISDPTHFRSQRGMAVLNTLGSLTTIENIMVRKIPGQSTVPFSSSSSLNIYLPFDYHHLISYYEWQWEPSTNVPNPVIANLSRDLGCPDDFPDDVVSSILRMVIATEPSHSQNSPHASSWHAIPKWNPLPVLTVCRRFRDLGLPILYAFPRLHNGPAMEKFVEILTLHPWGRFVQTITCRYFQMPENTLLTILHLCADIRAIRGSVKVSPAVLDSLSRTHPSFERFISSSFGEFPSPADVVSGLSNFSHLRVLSIAKCPVTKSPAERIARNSIELPSLERIEIGEFSGAVYLFLSTLAQASLPKLSVFLFQETCWDASVGHFLRSHGQQITELQIPDLCPDQSLSELRDISLMTVPNLKILKAYAPLDNNAENTPAFRFLCVDSDHKNLRELTVTSAGWNRLAREDNWHYMFGTLSFSRFPELRKMTLSGCKWPQNQKQLTEKGKWNHYRRWPMWSNQLQEKGITLLDENGVAWTGRLGY
ncbi:hypothetical protein DL96DRAFT_1049533 [Flagelloscypha sp. PMI_526]|nr:hypothetical protein DL96DRAFT_1049533 [Flagelloscypha sp. PMI_526]